LVYISGTVWEKIITNQIKKGKNEMTRQIVNVTKGVLTGMIIGGTAGVALACSMKKPARKSIRRTAVSAMDTVGAIMQNIADFTR